MGHHLSDRQQFGLHLIGRSQVIRQLRCISRPQFSSDQLFGHLQLIRHCQFIGHRQFIDGRPQLFRRPQLSPINR